MRYRAPALRDGEPRGRSDRRPSVRRSLEPKTAGWLLAQKPLSCRSPARATSAASKRTPRPRLFSFPPIQRRCSPVCLRRTPRPGCATRKATSRALASERGLARSLKDPATRGGGACLNGLSDPSWPPFDRKLQSAHDSACRHSLCRSLLARRRPGRQCLCDNPVGDELAEAGAPSRSHRRSRGCRSRGAAQRTVDRPGCARTGASGCKEARRR